MYNFNLDDDWKYIIIKETVYVHIYNIETETYDDPIAVDAFSYDNTKVPNDDVLRQEKGWVLRASQLDDVEVVEKTKIEQEDGTIWYIEGEIKLLTNNTRYVVTAYKG